VSDPSPTTLTDIAAWWGAATGTLVLLWDVFKWHHRGAAVSIEVNSTKVHPETTTRHETISMRVSVMNNGAQPTTITGFIGHWYRSEWSAWWKRPTETFGVLFHSGATDELGVIGTGEAWNGSLSTRKLQFPLKKGHLALGVFHTASKRGTFKRFKS
jgi:hypothetical protein